MGLFGKTALKPRPTVVHVAEVPVRRSGTVPVAKPSSASRPNGTPRRDSGQATPRVNSLKRDSSTFSTSPGPDRGSIRLQPSSVKRSSKKRSTASPAVYRPLDSDSEDDGSTTSFDQPPNKKQAIGRAVDTRRRLRSHQAFSDGDGGSLSYIRAKDIASLSLKSNRALGASEDDDLAIQLQYPSATQPEDYELVWSRDGLNPVEEVIKVVENVAHFYLTPEQAKPFDVNTGFLRSLERARNRAYRDGQNTIVDFKDTVNKYNAALKALREDGSLANNLDRKFEIPLELVSCILTQIYDRAVTPQVDTLRKYENGTDNVYGELKAGFLSRIFTETNLKSDHVFVDLGSGVGNVVLQAALEIGCESWGCEMMDNASKLALMQVKEFSARCQLWGIAPGKVKLRHNNFMEDPPTLKALKKADVVLVNNQAFTPQLNDQLKLLFLELKDGCRIVSLKSLVADQNSRNANDVTSNLSVEQKEYYSGSVSWTDVGGTYFIATKGGRRGQSSESSP